MPWVSIRSAAAPLCARTNDRKTNRFTPARAAALLVAGRNAIHLMIVLLGRPRAGCGMDSSRLHHTIDPAERRAPINEPASPSNQNPSVRVGIVLFALRVFEGRGWHYQCQSAEAIA